MDLTPLINMFGNRVIDHIGNRLRPPHPQPPKIKPADFLPPLPKIAAASTTQLIPEVAVAHGGVTELEMITYQKRQIAKECYKLEIHLQQKCKINNKACDCCLVPGTIIYGNPSIMPIEKPALGKVITHTGKTRPITEHFEHHYKGTMCEIKVGYTNIPLQVTPEHPILVSQGVRKAQRHSWRLNGGINENKLQWIPADLLTNHDFMAFPRIKDVVDKPLISGDLAELFGWYVAEGFKEKGNNRVGFSVGLEEYTAQERIKYLINSVFGKTPKIYMKPTTCHICITDHRTAEFIEFGIGARNKRIPSWMILLPEEKLYRFLKGMFGGDGCTQHYNLCYVTCSLELAYQLRLILFRLGLLHSLSERAINETSINGRRIKANGPRYDIGVAGDAARTFAEALGLEYDGGNRTVGNHGWISENYAFLPIKRISIFQYDGIVYNVAVEEDESYLTVHGAMHNCEKHPMIIEGLCEESLGMSAESIFLEILEWCRRVAPIVTVPASASGNYDEQYPQLAVELRGLRKKLIGTESLTPLIGPLIHDLQQQLEAAGTE